jgi:aryl-alcohol dehydrogenase-like predicted oxidoreductase
MDKVQLGRTGLTVSAFCLGTMTWGNQTGETDAHAQADMAVAHGVTFWDTAEMYPVNPIRAETVGRTEEFIGSWLASRGGRDRLVLATKVTGAGMVQVGGGRPITPAVMQAAVDASLRRLRTDHIDLYQLHWPNRGSYHFRQIWRYAPKADPAAVEADMLALLDCAQGLIRAGKIGHMGLSNESVWGAARWLRLADQHGLPRMMTVQNEYSLLCRQFDSDWAELAVMENMPLMAFSILATGLLTGKYADGGTPPGSRRVNNPDLGGRWGDAAQAAVDAYAGVARRHGLDLAQMAIAWVRTRPFPVVPILGATTAAQLAAGLDATSLTLTPEVLADIAAVHRRFPQPY